MPFTVFLVKDKGTRRFICSKFLTEPVDKL